MAKKKKKPGANRAKTVLNNPTATVDKKEARRIKYGLLPLYLLTLGAATFAIYAQYTTLLALAIVLFAATGVIDFALHKMGKK